MSDADSSILRPAASGESHIFAVPARHNPRLLAIAERINADDELRQLWRCAHINAVDRLGLGDCGEVHVRIVANAGLKLVRLLREGGEVASVVAHHRLTPDEAEVIVVLAAALHDLGLAVHGDPVAAGPAGLAMAARKAGELLAGLYPVRERTIVMAEVLHAISALPAALSCLTLEAGVLKLADALDMSKGRARLAPEAQHGLSGHPLMGVEEVTIQKSKTPPVRVIIRIGPAESVPGLETMLRAKLQNAALIDRVEVMAKVDSLVDPRLVPLRIWRGPS